jgi:hypothetical protein
MEPVMLPPGLQLVWLQLRQASSLRLFWLPAFWQRPSLLPALPVSSLQPF